MSIARVTEVKSGSKKSFEDAVSKGVERAAKTLENITGAWVADQEVLVEKNKVVEYRVLLKITFIMKE